MMAFPDGTRLKAPRIAAGYGRFGFINGRHRARVALLQGRKVPPVLVPKDNVAEVREVLSRFRGKPSRPCSARGGKLQKERPVRALIAVLVAIAILMPRPH